MKPYPVSLEISGPTAMWTRPDTGSSPVSYVGPTFSAVKGIFESVLRWKSVNVRPTKVEICAPVQFHRYTTNYPDSKSGLRRETGVCEIEHHKVATMHGMGFGGIRSFPNN